MVLVQLSYTCTCLFSYIYHSGRVNLHVRSSSMIELFSSSPYNNRHRESKEESLHLFPINLFMIENRLQIASNYLKRNSSYGITLDLPYPASNVFHGSFSSHKVVSSLIDSSRNKLILSSNFFRFSINFTANFKLWKLVVPYTAAQCHLSRVLNNIT